jgi:hypothetical protein
MMWITGGQKEPSILSTRYTPVIGTIDAAHAQLVRADFPFNNKALVGLYTKKYSLYYYNSL